MDPRIKREIEEAVFGKNDYEHIVTFYDHASYNEELSKASGRKRFTEKTYTLLKPTHPDLKVRDVVSHPTTQEEIEKYPHQWAEYQRTKTEQREFKPPLQAIPGMKVSYFRELQALGIYDAEALAKYEGDLGEIDHLRDLSRRIMEVARDARDLRERREAVRDGADRQQYESQEVPGGSVIRPIGGTPINAGYTQTSEAKGDQEKGHKEKGVQTFSYTFSTG